MSTVATQTKAAVIPSLRYGDAPAAIEWLCDTFGFARQLVVPGEDGTIAHAQLSFGDGMIMLGSAAPGSGRPSKAGGAGMQSIYVLVADPDATYARAVGAGAEITLAIKDMDYGGRGFACRDLEGHPWNFGSYDPRREG